MTENSSVKSNTLTTEAPASWNTRYTSPEGFICQITLRADSGKELLEKAQAAITHLLQVGSTPCDNLTFRPRNNGYGHGNGAKAKEVTVPADGTSNGTNGNNGTINPSTCLIHNVEMKRWEKEGRIWYSHKLDGGGWCTGKSK